MVTVIQYPSVIQPTAFYSTPPATIETIADALEHTSVEFEVQYLRDKMIYITATEVVTVGAPGNLLCWVELSPVLSTLSTAYWAAIGGGGGAIAPVAPIVEAGTGVNGTVHSILIPWNIHSVYARLVMQTLVPAAADYWTVQAIVIGQTT